MRRRRCVSASIAVFVAMSAVGAGHDAQAFCGFYVSGADAPLTNNATQVVLMRQGTLTVLSMQNNYQGPPQDFAMVVPVPVVLQKENVKTLPRDVFDRVDRLTAPRLVEYWEQDPCPQAAPLEMAMSPMMAVVPSPRRASAAAAAPAVKIEAQFTVGEYDIVVLSATDSASLDAWLRQNRYKIPAGAEPYLRPYVQLGMKFFVAKVDVSKVRFERLGSGPEQAILSPLRFHYDSDSFRLPIRLGLINSGGTQDLLVTVLARGQRYEVANYENVAIPTNIDVSDATRNGFGLFYATLFDDTLRRHPRAVVTEYSWAANSCDPCPTPPLETSDLMTLGADALATAPATPAMPWRPDTGGFVVTRLHARYSKDALGDDLVFRIASPIVGGREFVQTDGKLEQGARPDSVNNFQARYAMRHPWTGAIACAHPRRGVWGGPPGSDPFSAGPLPIAKPATRIAFVPRGAALTLAAFVRGALPPESLLTTHGPVLANRTAVAPTPTGDPGPATPDSGSAPSGSPQADLPGQDAAPPAARPPLATAPRGCAGCATSRDDASTGGAIAALVAIALARLRRRRA
jgi:MYXO-CTERM domain-containing protein